MPVIAPKRHTTAGSENIHFRLDGVVVDGSTVYSQDQFKPLQDLRLQYVDKLRALLTGDQKKTLDAELAKAHQRWAARHKPNQH